MSASVGMPVEQQRLLFASWLLRLAREAGLPIAEREATADGVRALGSPDGLQLTIRPRDHAPWVTVGASDSGHEKRVQELAQEAARRVDALDLGGNVWYYATAVEAPRDVTNIGEFMRLLGSQVAVAGWRRLGSRVLLDFAQAEDEDNARISVLTPRAKVDAHFRVPAPRKGDFASAVAARVIETALATASFALGRPVGAPMLVPFATKGERLQEVENRVDDAQIGNLARKGISLDVFEELVSVGGIESHHRVAAALRTFDAGMRQERHDVALVLFVAAAECLTVPFTPWRKDRLTKRFTSFFEELMPEDLDTIVAHGNAEEAFSFRRGQRSAKALRKGLLNSLYSLRSAPIHEGLAPMPGALLGMADTANLTRRGLSGTSRRWRSSGSSSRQEQAWLGTPCSKPTPPSSAARTSDSCSALLWSSSV